MDVKKGQEKERDLYSEAVKKIREVIESDPDYVKLSEDALRKRAGEILYSQMSSVTDDEEMKRYYSSLSFRTRGQLVEDVFFGGAVYLVEDIRNSIYAAYLGGIHRNNGSKLSFESSFYCLDGVG